jgi:hypothetical protein
MNYHYSKTVPTGKLVGFGVWEGEKFKGCVVFGRGVGNAQIERYGIPLTSGAELVRVALREHEAPVTKIVSIAIKMLRKHSPGLRILVSYADSRQGHLGIIYQAGNWVYTGKAKTTPDYLYKGKYYHVRSMNRMIKNGKFDRAFVNSLPTRSGGERLRYLYPLDDDMRQLVEGLRKPYPKRDEHESNAVSFHDTEGGAVPTISHQLAQGGIVKPGTIALVGEGDEGYIMPKEIYARYTS